VFLFNLVVGLLAVFSSFPFVTGPLLILASLSYFFWRDAIKSPHPVRRTFQTGLAVMFAWYVVLEIFLMGNMRLG
jgi:hypothetical protein